ncbi:MAG: hypothetical protein IJH37_08960 [Clostridia bacterium]|nr:hypothetical protein [Clostridia bacterium]
MSEIVKTAASMMEMLPENDKTFVYEFIKKMVLAWDPDFTKVTNAEAERIDNAEKSGFLYDDEIDWDNLDQIA